MPSRARRRDSDSMLLVLSYKCIGNRDCVDVSLPDWYCRNSFRLIPTWEKSRVDSDLTRIFVNSREQMISEPYRPVYHWKERSEALRMMYPPGPVTPGLSVN